MNEIVVISAVAVAFAAVLAMREVALRVLDGEPFGRQGLDE